MTSLRSLPNVGIILVVVGLFIFIFVSIIVGSIIFIIATALIIRGRRAEARQQMRSNTG